ncbi:MAG: hypothetical protein DCC68_18260 [Planctomycetota bacterium]|nr:MAG: hypothetical protein DCC68_18260 [Planctomycetota bacterium]
MAKEKKTKEKAKPKEKKEKSSSGGMQQMLMDHGEKIGLGIAGAIFLACVVFGFIGKTKLDDSKTIASLETAIGGVKQRMDDVKPPAMPNPTWVKLADNPAKIPPAPLALNPWVPPIFELQGVRSEPKYFPAEQLRVIAGRAPFNVGGAADATAPGVPAAGGAAAGGGPPEGSSSKGEFYVVGTFLIPVGKQRAEYDRVFADTQKMPGDERLAQDKPEYFRYVLERAQVTPGTPDDQLQWVALNEADNAGVTEDNRFPALLAKRAEWAVLRQDIVPTPFTEPVLTYGKVLAEDETSWLPPRLPEPTTQWTWSEVGHGVIADMVTKFTEQSKAAAAAAGPDAPAEADPEEAMRKFVDTQPYKLGRFWDFAVEPGASYRYRITLVLRNPNRGYTKQFLKDEKLSVGDFRPASPLDAAETNRPVSEASYVVQVPGRTEIVVGGIVPDGESGNRTGEDAATVAASVWENTAEAIADYEKEVNAIRVPRLKAPAQQALETLKEVWAKVDYVEAALEFRVFRGQFLSMKAATQITHPLFNKVETLKNVRFDTGFTLVDMRGGKAPAKPAGPAAAAAPAAMAPPVEYLLLDPEGNLVIRSEIGDRAAYKRKLAAVTQAAAEDAASGANTIDQLNK